MIKPAENLIVLNKNDNCYELLNLDILEEELVNVVFSNGYSNKELIYDIIHLVKLYLINKYERNEKVSLSDLEELVFKLLSDSGFETFSNLLKHTDILSSSEAEKPAKTACFYLKKNEIVSLLSKTDLCWIKNDIITFNSISLLLPVIIINIDMKKFFESISNSCFLELNFYPEFNTMCIQLKSSIELLKIEICNRTKLIKDIDICIKLVDNHNESMCSMPFCNLHEFKCIVQHIFDNVNISLLQ